MTAAAVGWRTPPMTQLVPWAATPANVVQRTVCVNGAEIAYRRQGHGRPGPFLQGVGLPARAWGPQVGDLHRRFATIAVDNRGVGNSATGGGALTIDRMADDALAVIDAEGLDRVHVVGHSMGGLIALRLALAVPDRVASLTLLCSFADGRAVRRLPPMTLWRALRARLGSRAMRRRGMLRLILPAPYLRSVDRVQLAHELEVVLGHDLADQPAAAFRQWLATTRCDLTDRLIELRRVPTLVASAAHDLIAPPALGRALAAGLSARFVVFPHAGHGLPIQCARAVNAALTQHLLAADTAPTAAAAGA